MRNGFEVHGQSYEVQSWNGDSLNECVGPMSLDAAREVARALSSVPSTTGCIRISPADLNDARAVDYWEVWVGGACDRAGTYGETTLVTVGRLP